MTPYDDNAIILRLLEQLERQQRIIEQLVEQRKVGITSGVGRDEECPPPIPPGSEWETPKPYAELDVDEAMRQSVMRQFKYGVPTV